jgi:3'-phosphoadenosine 5'-phosphosulfate sulfotransferase (PAPS reductase)/FAD synthetase
MQNNYSEDGKVHDLQRLKELQALPLWRKIQITQTRIIEWYNYYEGKVYVSFSGGKDSTVLLDLARRIFPEIEAVFVDTGLEYDQIRNFVKTFDNVTWLKPKMRFDEVINKYGYPIISKTISKRVYDASKKIDSYAHSMFGGTYKLKKNGDKSQYNCEKWKFLLDAPFLISNKCCDIMKKEPLHRFQKISGKNPIIGTMANESRQRKEGWIKTGCNAFNSKDAISKPLSFWTEQDVLQYLLMYKIPYCSVYGDIIKDDNGKLKTTGQQRTGCVFCGYGAHLEKNPNRYEKLKEIDFKKWDYCMRDIEDNGLGFGKVLDFIGVNYGKKEK